MDLKYEQDRFARQKMIEGWEQEKLEEARIAVVGVDYISQFLLSAFAGLGLGQTNHHGYITLYGWGNVTEDDKKNYPLYLEAEDGEKKTETLERIVKKINPNIQICGINIEAPEKYLKHFLGEEDLIVETGNDPTLKKMLIDYSRKDNKPLISVSCDETQYKIVFPKIRKRITSFENQEQGALSGLIAAGIVTEEIRKLFMPLESDIGLTTNYLSYKIFKNGSNRKKFQDRCLLFIGAGALNNFSIFIAALYGFGIDVVDPDIVESLNLNRQVYFYEALGKNKAEVIRQRLSNINDKIKDFPAKFDKNFEKYFENNRPDVIIGGVDNWEARNLLNKLSLKYKIPYVDGGTDYNFGRSITTYPEKTTCIDCLVNVRELAEKEKEAGGCEQQMPSVIMSNMVTAGLVMSEVLKVIEPSTFGNPHNGILGFHSNSEKRLFIRKEPSVCECYKKVEI